MQKTIAIIILSTILSISFLVWVGYRNVETTKSNCAGTWKQAGYEIVGYEGYHWSPLAGGSVWHLVRKEKDNGIVYSGYIEKWGSEYHIYHLRAVDAIKPNNL